MPSTPSNRDCKLHTPAKPIKRREFDTIKRGKFFNAYDNRSPSDSLAGICHRADINIPPPTARFWLKQRETLGSPALRRTRKISARLGRPFTLLESQLEELEDPKHPLHKAPYETIIKELNLPISAHRLQQNCSKRRGAKRFKNLRSKAISPWNKEKRVVYGHNHSGKGIYGFWRRIWFTDEVHFNSQDLAEKAEYSLRQPGAEARLAEIQEAPITNLNVTLHVAGGISYDFKGDLIFYNDPEEPAVVRKHNKARPRRSQVETEEEYQEKVKNWQASLPYNPEIKGGGNSMTMKHYVEHILPKHIASVKRLEAHYQQRYWLQEDND